MKKILNVDERWEQGIPHDPRSKEIASALADIDMENGDSLCLKFGGDGDNGEELMYLLDIYFARKDAESQRLENIVYGD